MCTAQRTLVNFKARCPFLSFKSIKVLTSSTIDTFCSDYTSRSHNLPLDCVHLLHNLAVLTLETNLEQPRTLLSKKTNYWGYVERRAEGVPLCVVQHNPHYHICCSYLPLGESQRGAWTIISRHFLAFPTCSWAQNFRILHQIAIERNIFVKFLPFLYAMMS